MYIVWHSIPPFNTNEEISTDSPLTLKQASTVCQAGSLVAEVAVSIINETARLMPGCFILT
ncbi:hypothetical protein KDAU_72830 [Dictyobacter aurantiacus]|uniref:Uncharacterized protein n=1 Tax=Dictyobacter aurantiacus TaxID=1936993 RepID=A0A401ZT45_9CHLR|nr:hypothetical protein KDAU_72830 [Dictyobacter aurantiacus]